METFQITAARELVQHWRRERPWLTVRNAERWRKIFANEDWLEPWQCEDLAYDMLACGSGDFVGGLTGIAPESRYHNPGAKKEAWGYPCYRVEAAAYALVIAHRIGLSVGSLDVIAPLVGRLKARRTLSLPELCTVWASREPSSLVRPARVLWKQGSADQFPEVEFTRLAGGRIVVTFKPADDIGAEIVFGPAQRLTPKIKSDLADAGFFDFPRLSAWLAEAMVS